MRNVATDLCNLPGYCESDSAMFSAGTAQRDDVHDRRYVTDRETAAVGIKCWNMSDCSSLKAKRCTINLKPVVVSVCKIISIVANRFD